MEAGPEPASKKPRILRVGEESLAVNDEVLESAPEWEDPAVYAEHLEEAWPYDPEDPGGDEADLECDEEELWFDAIPSLSEDELRSLDTKADFFEINRLIRKGVLKALADDEQPEPGTKSLSSKFVRTWRRKPRHGKEAYLRRSRLCAREYRWLEVEREGLYSPATNSAVTKLVPWFFSRMKDQPDQYSILSLDVKDAYLECPQLTPVIASLPRDFPAPCRYMFLKCVPGQRDGSIRWYDLLLAFLQSKIEIHVCPVCPALFTVNGSPGDPGLVHVDDLNLVAKTLWLKQTFIPLMEERFEVSYAIASEPGDTYQFLKRTHLLTPAGIIVQAPEVYAQRLAEVVGLKPGGKTVATPCTKELLGLDATDLIGQEDARKFRTGVGIAMYVSSDRPDIAFTVRALASRLTEPTALAWRGLKRLAAYLLSTATYGCLVAFNGTGSSILNPHPEAEASQSLLESFTDADWCGCQRTRRSYSACSHYLDSALIYTTCRQQKVVSLSSCESEWYALTTGAADSIYLKQVVEFKF